MESLQSLKRRRKAVSNIGAITKAMEVVAAIKMRKSEEVALDSRPYAYKALELLERLSRFSKIESIFAKKSESKKTLAVVITSDRGLIGSFNSQVLRIAENFISPGTVFIAVGKKAEAYLMKKNAPIARRFYGFGDFVDVSDISELYEFLVEGFKNGDWEKVVTISMHFRSALKQETFVREILPVNVVKIRETIKELIPEHGRYSSLEVEPPSGGSTSGLDEIDYIFEPSKEELIESLIPHLIKMQIYHLVLEANSSEHAARYVAMKNASDNAEELSENLIIHYNKVRQAAITSELVEMSATQAALK